MSQAIVIAKAKQGNEAAITTLVTEHQQAVGGFLIQLLGDAETAKDVTQESFVKAIKALSHYNEQGTFKAWLLRIARNTAMDYLRKSSRRGGTHLELLEESTHINESSLDLISKREECDIAMQLMARLPKVEREVMQLRVIENLKFKDIASITNAPLNTVLGRMRNATTRMKQWMEEMQ